MPANERNNQILDDGFNGQGRNVAVTADGYRKTTDPACIGMKAFVERIEKQLFALFFKSDMENKRNTYIFIN